MGLFDRGGDDSSPDEPPADADDAHDAEEGGAPGAAAAQLEAEPAPEEDEPEEPTGPNYLAYDRHDPPEAVRNQFGDREGTVDDEVLDVLDAYVTDEGTIREDILALSLDRLEEWVDVEEPVGGAKFLGRELAELVDERTVDVREDLPEDEFFSTSEGFQTVTNRYDLEKAVPFEKKRHFTEVERYWVNKPYAFAIVFHSSKGNENKYYIIEPYFNPEEEELQEFLSEKLRAAIKYESDDVLAKEGEDEDEKRTQVLERETRRLLKRFDLYEGDSAGDAAEGESGLLRLLNPLTSKVGVDLGGEPAGPSELEGISARPEPTLLDEGTDQLSEYQFEKLLYKIKRDFVGYERIDAVKHDINIEEISCDGYYEPVFVTHSEYDWLITNISYDTIDSLDKFVVKLAQRSGKGISKRNPQVDATLPDGSRSQLTLGREVSDHGTNYTIRQFQDVPHTPIDLINWHTFSLDLMAYLWLAIENHKSLIFSGGTASGKTTNLNACSLFIPSSTKIVSIEDTREVELPQRNWVASVTRPSFSDDEQGDIDEFDLLEAALRQRPDYIVMGEIRGEEGRTLFQVMSTGHTTYTTFHADTVGEVLKRFTTDPINVSKTLFTALDLVAINRQTRLEGRKVRKTISLTEINDYNADNDEINVQDVFRWRADEDEFEEVGQSNLLDEIMFDRGWSEEELDREMFKRRLVLAYLIDKGLNTYAQVAATLQAFMSDPDTILGLMANDALAAGLDDLQEMESVLIDIQPEKEEMVPRPDPNEKGAEEARRIVEEARETILQDYVDVEPSTSALEAALSDTAAEAEPVAADAAVAAEAAPSPDSGPDGSPDLFEESEPAEDSVVGANGGQEPEDGGVADLFEEGVQDGEPDDTTEEAE
jgi:flagellar protein FlaI